MIDYKSRIPIILAAGFLFGGALAWAAQALPTFKPQQLPEGAPKTLVSKVCVECHTLDRVVKARELPDDWDATIDTMLEKGAEVTDADLPDLLAYLNANFNPQSPYEAAPGGAIKLNLNLANAAQLQGFLGLTAEQAAAVVAWRTAHGPFADAGALNQVPELAVAVNADTLAAWAAQLSF